MHWHRVRGEWGLSTCPSKAFLTFQHVSGQKSLILCPCPRAGVTFDSSRIEATLASRATDVLPVLILEVRRDAQADTLDANVHGVLTVSGELG